MAVNMKGESLASLADLTKEEIEQILKTSELLKLQTLRGQEHSL
jgi:ornithine carbamoyltransferase